MFAKSRHDQEHYLPHAIERQGGEEPGRSREASSSSETFELTLTKESLRLAFIPLEASKSVKHCDGNWCTSVTEVGRGEAFSGGENRPRDEFIVTQVAGVSVYSIDFPILQFPHHTFRLSELHILFTDH